MATNVGMSTDFFDSTDPKSIDIRLAQKWDIIQLVNYNSPHITQSPEWAQFRLETGNVKKVLYFDSIQVYIHKIPYTPFKVGYLPKVEMPKNLEKIKKDCQKENCIYLKIEPLNGAGGSAGSILPQHTIYIDLTKPEEDLLSAMHEKTRYNIRLAQKKGVVVKNETTPEALEKFIKILEQTEKRQGFYSHYPDYYRKLWKILFPKKMIYLLSAYVEDNFVAGIILFHYQDVLYYPYGGSNPAFKEYMAPNLLHWEAIKLGKKLGCKIYDLWGSYKNSKTESDPWWGIYRFKSGFGGTEVDFPRAVDIPLSPLYYPLMVIDKLRWLFLKIF